MINVISIEHSTLHNLNVSKKNVIINISEPMAPIIKKTGGHAT